MEKVKTNYTIKLFQAFLKKYGKKWNAKVYDENLTAVPNLPNIPVTIIENYTRDEAICSRNFATSVFILRRLCIGAEAVSETIQNNIISQTDKLIVINKYLQIFVFIKN